MRNIKVATIGEILFDVFEGEKKPGGSSLNVSLHLHQQHISTQFISALGNDENGDELMNYLKSQKFPGKYIQKSELPTSTVTVKLNEEKQATYVINQPVAWDDIELNDDLIELVKAADAFVYCSLTCRSEKSRKTIYELLNHAQTKIFDINLRAPHYEIEILRHLLIKADILKINEDELDYLRKEISLPTDENDALEILKKKFQLDLICLTLGDKGAKILYENEFYNHSSYPVKVKDTVGAGDAFLATFIAGYLKNLKIEKILEQACKVGAFVASQSGAHPDYPESFLE